MNKSTLIALFVLAVVLGGLAYFASDDKEQGGDSFRPGTLLSVLGAEPDSFRMTNRDGTKTYALRLGDRGWMLTDPVEDEAEASRVQMLLGQLLHAERKIGWPDGKPSPRQISEAGLDDPLGRLVIASKDREVVVEFGAECFPVGYRFARVNGEVCRIPAGIEEALEANREEWINSLLFLTSGQGLRRVTMTRQDEAGEPVSIVVERNASNAFTIARPGQATPPLPADPERLGGLLASLLSARVQRFLPKGGIAAPAPQPWMTIVVDGDHGREEVVLTSPSQGTVDAIKRYPQTQEERPSRMIVDAVHFERFVLESLEDLISTQIWTYGPAAASSIRVESAGADAAPALVLGRNGDEAFTLVSPKAGPAHPPAVNALIVALERTKLVSMVEGRDEVATKALAVPRYKVRLEPPTSKPALGAFEVRLGVADDGRVFAQRKGEGPGDGQGAGLIWLVDSPDLAQLAQPWWSYGERVAFRFGSNTRPLSGIAVQSGRKRIVFAPGDQGWGRKAETTAEKIELDQDFEEAVYDSLRELKSKEVASGEATSFLAGLQPLAKIELLATGEGREIVMETLHFFAEGEAGLLTRREGDAIVHRLYERSARLLRRYFEALRG